MVSPDPARDAAFDELVAEGGELAYDLPYPTWRLLARAVDCHGALLHGSNRTDVSRFEPREQTAYKGATTTGRLRDAGPDLADLLRRAGQGARQLVLEPVPAPRSVRPRAHALLLLGGGDVDESWTTGRCTSSRAPPSA